MGIWIVPLGTSETCTLGAWERIERAEQLFLQTERHPAARRLVESGLAYTSMDDLYERAADFDALNDGIAERLAEAGECVYAVTGRVAETQLPAIRRAAGACGLTVSVLPGVPDAVAAFPGAEPGRIVSAHQLPDRADPLGPLYIEEIDTAIAAGEVKLFLAEYWPDGWTVQFARLDESGAYRVRETPLFELDRQSGYDASCVVRVPKAAFEDLKRYGYAELHAVMARLRGPGGCPWDREQTHESLKGALLEECYEVLDAIDRADDAGMCEELGDVLLQVVFHAAIAAEQARFTERDVTTALVDKLVYRHPHIFGSVRADTPDAVLRNWEALKKKEKGQKTQTEALMSVPRSFPALTRSCKVQKKAANVGFDWQNAAEAFYKIAEETEELRRALETGEGVAEEAGDLLFAVVNVARLIGLDPEFTLAAATDKFIDRFARMERLAAQDGVELTGLSLKALDRYWTRAKKQPNTGENFTN